MKIESLGFGTHKLFSFVCRSCEKERTETECFYKGFIRSETPGVSCGLKQKLKNCIIFL